MPPGDLALDQLWRKAEEVWPYWRKCAIGSRL